MKVIIDVTSADLNETHAEMKVRIDFEGAENATPNVKHTVSAILAGIKLALSMESHGKINEAIVEKEAA